jgi:hypothetical protein
MASRRWGLQRNPAGWERCAGRETLEGALLDRSMSCNKLKFNKIFKQLGLPRQALKKCRQSLTDPGNWYMDFDDIDINDAPASYATILERRLLDGF